MDMGQSSCLPKGTTTWQYDVITTITCHSSSGRQKITETRLLTYFTATRHAWNAW